MRARLRLFIRTSRTSSRTLSIDALSDKAFVGVKLPMSQTRVDAVLGGGVRRHLYPLFPSHRWPGSVCKNRPKLADLTPPYG